MVARRDPAFVAFDVLALESGRPLIALKKILRRLIPRRSRFLL
jgi:hypothetical protein